MAHKHQVIDTDPQFAINVDTRTITDQAPTGTLLMQGDHNSERITFTCPKLVDDHDLSQCDRIEIHFINTGSSGKSNDGLYLVDDKQAFADNIRFSWLVSNQATMYNGALSFAIKFICSSEKDTDYGPETTVDYVWSTAIYNSIPVGKGMDNAQSIVTQYADLIGYFYNQFVAAGNDVIADFNKKVEEKIAEVSKDNIIPVLEEKIETQKINAMTYIYNQAYDIANEVLLLLPKAEGVSF